MFDLTGKVALVTGASGGIGGAIAKSLHAQGATVVLSGTKVKALEKLAAELGGRAYTAACNLSDIASVEALPKAAETAAGAPIDILVNNAGVYEFAPLEAINPDHFHKQFNINVLGLLLTTQAFVAQVPKTGASIINIGSVVGAMAAAHGSVYSATKGAVDSITVSLSKELGPRGIRVNALNPGLIRTEGTYDAGFAEGDFEKTTVAGTPLGRAGVPKDVATVATFLASDDSAWLTGQTIYAAGGFRM